MIKNTKNHAILNNVEALNEVGLFELTKHQANTFCGGENSEKTSSWAARLGGMLCLAWCVVRPCCVGTVGQAGLALLTGSELFGPSSSKFLSSHGLLLNRSKGKDDRTVELVTGT